MCPRHHYSREDLSRMRENPWLTRREKQVFDLIYVDGLTSYDAAAELDISRRTIFNDLASIRKKCT